MYYKVLWEVIRKNKRVFGMGALLIVILSLLPLLQSLAVQEFVLRIQTETGDKIIGMALVYAGLLFVIPNVFRQMQSYLNKILDYVVKVHMVRCVYDKACKVPVKYYENADQVSLLHRALDANSSSSQTIILALVNIVLQAITCVVLAVRFGWLGLGLLLVGCSTALLSEKLEYTIRRMDYTFFRDREAPERFVEILKRLLIDKKSVPELYAYGTRAVYVERLSAKQQELDKMIGMQNRKRFWYILLVSIVHSFSSGLFYLMIVLAACYSLISVPMAIGVFSIVGSYSFACASLVQSFANLRAQKLACKEFEEMMDLPEEAIEKLTDPHDSYLTLKDVHYQYPGSSREALSGISLRIRPGEKIALVGDNGAGKSTMVRLLLGLDEPTSGSIFLDVPSTGRSYRINAFREYTTMMLQNFCKYPFTVRENIEVGNIREKNRVEETVACLDLKDMVEKMPDGLETELISNGILSGGEWQMVALSRSYLKKGSFVILDEPTAAMDAKREIWLYRKFLEMIREHTAVIVSHRLPVCQLCDRILVLQHGKIVESGTHKELIERNGIYATMYQQQAQLYR